ncbi:uncharacterized protein LOC130902101 [Diorhabda carinulata]|uniref:uncharacterized protein LOC130902101 n=1 Tax=Diorhabda carinulata TaxID=1163345 RepID=UPI0025A165B1|nr:uncharacterized protein LOC130902101 [Diorhabda carinulata]
MKTEDLESNKLKGYFKQIIEGKKVEADITVLNSILSTTLGINVTILHPKFKCILPHMLIHFIKCWPGWKKAYQYYSQQITLEDWYQKFKEYLIYKFQYMIKNDCEEVVAMLRYQGVKLVDEVVDKQDVDTQTNHNVEKTIAPFSVEVTGTPKILNSLVFSEGTKDDVFVKQYNVTTLWGPPLNERQLINWPHIEIEFQSNHLHFKRTNKHDFDRCLTFSSEKIFFKNIENFVENIDIIDENIDRKAYTLNAVKEYCNAFIDFVKTKENVLDSSNTINEVETILNDFIFDIKDINMNSIATNTSVIFNIGNSMYARNKIIKTSDRAICFGECITPKMLLSLFSFTAITDPTITSFNHLFNDNNKLSLLITYKCTYCNISFKKSIELWNHLQNAHIMEQPVLCFKCKAQFNVSNLTNNRWFHNCSKASRTE